MFVGLYACFAKRSIQAMLRCALSKRTYLYGLIGQAVSFSVLAQTIMLTDVNGCRYQTAANSTVKQAILRLDSEKPCSASSSEPNGYAFGVTNYTDDQSPEDRQKYVVLGLFSNGRSQGKLLTFVVNPFEKNKFDATYGVYDDGRNHTYYDAQAIPSLGHAWLDSKLAELKQDPQGFFRRYVALPDDPKARGRSARGG
jgi:hypothetical protein